MAKEYEIMVASNDFILSMRLLKEAYSDFENEKIMAFHGMAKPDHIVSLYVLTERNLYLYNAANSVKFMDSPIFKIPIGCISSFGYGKTGLTDIVYATLKDGSVITLKNYLESNQLVPAIVDINGLIKSDLVDVANEDKVEAVAMQLTKPVIKRDEYYGDYLSPYTFETKNGYYEEYMKKRESIVKKLKKSKDYGKEKVAFSYSPLGLKVKDVLASI